MGANMARRLHNQGFRIAAVYDVHRPAAETLAAELGCHAPGTLAAVTAGADIVFTVVTDDDAQIALFATNGDSLLEGAAGKFFINCATVSPSVHREIGERCERAGAHSLEACMASSIPQAL